MHNDEHCHNPDHNLSGLLTDIPSLLLLRAVLCCLVWLAGWLAVVRRWQHASCVYGGLLWLWGGHRQGQYLNDMWRYQPGNGQRSAAHTATAQLSSAQQRHCHPHSHSPRQHSTSADRQPQPVALLHIADPRGCCLVCVRALCVSLHCQRVQHA